MLPTPGLPAKFHARLDQPGRPLRRAAGCHFICGWTSHGNIFLHSELVPAVVKIFVLQTTHMRKIFAVC
jgi:hypothetical protein